MARVSPTRAGRAAGRPFDTGPRKTGSEEHLKTHKGGRRGDFSFLPPTKVRNHPQFSQTGQYPKGYPVKFT